MDMLADVLAWVQPGTTFVGCSLGPPRHIARGHAYVKYVKFVVNAMLDVHSGGPGDEGK